MTLRAVDEDIEVVEVFIEQGTGTYRQAKISDVLMDEESAKDLTLRDIMGVWAVFGTMGISRAIELRNDVQNNCRPMASEEVRDWKRDMDRNLFIEIAQTSPSVRARSDLMEALFDE